jgi:ribonuclease HI
VLDPDPIKKKATEDTIAMLGTFDVEMWTDGSVIDKLGAGAARIYTKEGKATFDAIAPAGFLSSSFRSETVALDCGLKKMISLKKMKLMGKSILICTDSQSLISALANGPLCQGSKLLSEIWETLVHLAEVRGVKKVVFQFVYSHCGVERNETADKMAEEALRKFKSVDQRKAPIPLQAVKAMIKLQCRNGWKSDLEVTRPRYQACEAAFTDLKSSCTLSRKEEVKLAQLRTGECIWMGKLRTRLGIGSSLCRWCKGEEETVVHVYSFCKDERIESLREELEMEDVRQLHKNPRIGLTFCERALSLLGEI